MDEILARITALDAKVDRILELLEPRATRKIAIPLTLDVQRRIVGDFLRECVRVTLSPDHRITRTDLHATYFAYVYHWLRREVTYRGMSEEKAQSVFAQRLGQTAFTRVVSDFARAGNIDGMGTCATSHGRAWNGVVYRNIVREMRLGGDTFELRHGPDAETRQDTDATDEGEE